MKSRSKAIDGRFQLHFVTAGLIVLLVSAPAVDLQADVDVDFNRDIRPLLSDRCFLCHGPDNDEGAGGFRLDAHASATAVADSGARPLVPHDAENSEILRRLQADDESQRMPPIDSGKPPLTAQQIDLIRKWIDKGGQYQKHWAFVTPERAPTPQVSQSDWVRDPIDQYLLSKMESASILPNEAADRPTWLRRVTFDLTGLPPTPDEIATFSADQNIHAYETVVSRLLDSDRFGERMATIWLDAARYADTNGYLQNGYRVSWPWRDWLVKSFNDNKLYDRFVSELIAGDLLPDADDQSRLATMFQRLHMITSEGGSLDEEFRVEYAADRVETTSAVFLGLTVNCCRCHDHKFDPLSQREYYQMFAMFVDPEGEDPVKDHSRAPSFPPVLSLASDQFAEESQRLVECVATNKKVGNELAQARLSLQQEMLAKGLPVMVMVENSQPRQNYVLRRGAYDQPDSLRPVQPGAIDSLFPWNEHWPRNRLGLARWLTDPGHPLTARVEVNRIWTSLFGRGLVATQEDFGRQGSYPSHPRLLDYLAVEFRESGWDRKALIRRLVLSAAYRQSSVVHDRHRQIDPQNKLFARMNRRRLSAEAIRDASLFVAGILVEHVGGHPVLPYQPAGLWREGANGPGTGRGELVITGIYEPSSGTELYRRSLYTFWNRNAPPPQMLLFDVPGRSFAAVTRNSTNTPLQALVTMNDPQYLEAARFLAKRTLQDKQLLDDVAKVTMLYLRCTGKRPDAATQTDLIDGLEHWRHRYRVAPDDAETLLDVGEQARDTSLDLSEHAAWMMLSTTVMNLDNSLVLD